MRSFTSNRFELKKRRDVACNVSTKVDYRGIRSSRNQINAAFCLVFKAAVQDKPVEALQYRFFSVTMGVIPPALACSG